MRVLKIEFVNIKYRRSSNEKSSNYSIRCLLDFNKISIHNRVLRFFVINNIKRFIIYILIRISLNIINIYIYSKIKF